MKTTFKDFVMSALGAFFTRLFGGESNSCVQEKRLNRRRRRILEIAVGW
jgi:hypothetical protein